MPRVSFDSLFARLALLLAAVLFATLAVSVWTLRVLSLQPGSAQFADLLAGQIVAQASSQGVHVAAPPVSDVQWRTAPPETAGEAMLPFLRQVETRLKTHLGEHTRVLVEPGPNARLWVSLPGDDAHWIGVPVPPVVEQATRLTAIVLLVSATLVLVAAGWFARRLARPIGELATQAQALMDGQSPSAALSAQAPRELRLLAQALQQAGAARERTARERALLLAGLSHDLRTPLARLRLALELDPGDAELRAGMTRDVEEIDAILAQFIDFARGGGDEPAQRQDLAALLREAATGERLDAAWTLHGVDSPCEVTLRPLALRRAVVNLLRNAQRHGAAPFELELMRMDDEVRIAVRDRGPGIAPERLPELAQPFVRGDAARGGSGTGLGLAVAEQVARLHRGELQLAVREGGGFEAELRLPITDR